MMRPSAYRDSPQFAGYISRLGFHEAANEDRLLDLRQGLCEQLRGALEQGTYRGFGILPCDADSYAAAMQDRVAPARFEVLLMTDRAVVKGVYCTEMYRLTPKALLNALFERLYQNHQRLRPR